MWKPVLGETFKIVCKLLGIKHTHSTSFRPQSNGWNERSHRSLIEFLRSYVADDLSTWDQWVKYALFVHNTTPHSATNYMPVPLFPRVSQTTGNSGRFRSTGGSNARKQVTRVAEENPNRLPKRSAKESYFAYL
jgi:hypothetical protein